MTRISRSRSARDTALRLAGAVTSAAAVALVGTAALPASTAAAAGVVDDHPRPVIARSDPAALPSATGTPELTYRWVEGSWHRA